MKRELKIGLMALGAITLVLLVAASLILWRGSLHNLFRSKKQLDLYVQAPPLAELGEVV